MFYWNQSNFEGLKSVGEEYLSKQGYEDFANYCLYKEKGLKKKANESIRKYVSNINTWDVEKKRELSQELASLWFWHQGIHQLLSHPLHQFVFKTLQEWCETEPNNALAHRWFAVMGGGLEHFEKALKIDRKDEISISRLAQAHINDVDYQTHHLSESLLIGTEEELEASINEATIYVSMLYTDKLKDALVKEISYYSDLFHAWKEYNTEKTGESFPEWSKSKGKEFNFWSIVYYEE